MNIETITLKKEDAQILYVLLKDLTSDEPSLSAKERRAIKVLASKVV